MERSEKMNLKDHEKLDILMFGKSYPEVHQWIDECFDDYARGGKHEDAGNAYYHWIERHHLQAIRDKFIPKKGKDNVTYVTDEKLNRYEAAKLHIIADWLTHWGHPELPHNKEEVIKLLDEKLGLK